METLPLFLCTDACPGLIEGLWAALGTIAIGALVTLLMAVHAVDKNTRAQSLIILVAGGLSTLIAARFVGVAIWRMLDPSSLG